MRIAKVVRKIRLKPVLRFRVGGLSLHQIEEQGVSQYSVIRLERAVPRERLTWEIAAGMSDAEVYEGLYPRAW